jgi:hypothetical protein
MIINVDLDGVVYRFEPEFRKLVERARVLWGDEPTEKLKPADQWALGAAYGISEAQGMRIFEQGVTNFSLFSSGDMMAEAGLWLNRINKRHDVRFVTEPGFQGKPQVRAMAIKQKTQWLADVGLGNYPVIYSSGSKQGYPADVIVDDKPSLKWAQEGKVNILFDQPWNQTPDYHTPWLGQYLIRCKSWQDVSNEIARRNG